MGRDGASPAPGHGVTPPDILRGAQMPSYRPPPPRPRLGRDVHRPLPWGTGGGGCRSAAAPHTHPVETLHGQDLHFRLCKQKGPEQEAGSEEGPSSVRDLPDTNTVSRGAMKPGCGFCGSERRGGRQLAKPFCRVNKAVFALVRGLVSPGGPQTVPGVAVTSDRCPAGGRDNTAGHQPGPRAT